MQTESVSNEVTFEPISGTYKMRFDDVIAAPSYYRFELEALSCSKPDDDVVITINSDGGGCLRLV